MTRPFLEKQMYFFDFLCLYLRMGLSEGLFLEQVSMENSAERVD